MPILTRFPGSGGKRPLDPSKLSPTLSGNSWKMIARASEEGIASTSWKVGDEMDIVLSGDYKGTVTMQIAGFDHDALAAGGKAGITFLSKQILAGAPMYPGSSSNGWEGSLMRTDTMPKIKASLPGELQRVIKTALKTSIKGLYTPTITTEDDIFIPSAYEVFTRGDSRIDSDLRKGTVDDGVRYEIFRITDSAVKSTQTGVTGDWWLRTSYVAQGYIKETGLMASTYPNRSYGICFGFCI